jgi:hypothetical protein
MMGMADPSTGCAARRAKPAVWNILSYFEKV